MTVMCIIMIPREAIHSTVNIHLKSLRIVFNEEDSWVLTSYYIHGSIILNLGNERSMIHSFISQSQDNNDDGRNATIMECVGVENILLQTNTLSIMTV
jgi:hypothetical protein